MTASRASSAIRGPNRDVNLVPIHDDTTFSIAERSQTSTSNARRSTAASAVSIARVSPRMTTVACMLCSRKGSAAERSSPAGGGCGWWLVVERERDSEKKREGRRKGDEKKKKTLSLSSFVPRMMTLVVPSPTSSSCVRESSMTDWFGFVVRR